MKFKGFTQNGYYGNQPQPFEVVFYSIDAKTSCSFTKQDLTLKQAYRVSSCFVLCYEPKFWQTFKRNECPFDDIWRQNFSQLIVLIELCMSSKLFYKVLIIYLKTNPYFWSLSCGKQPLLWPLVRKKKLIPLNIYLKFHTHLEENLARSLQNVFDKCPSVKKLHLP